MLAGRNRRSALKNEFSRAGFIHSLEREPAQMICIGNILKSHKISGEFVCRLFNALEVDSSGFHRLSNLCEIDLRHPHKPTQHFVVHIETLQAHGSQVASDYSHILLLCQEWSRPEQVKPYHGWELWVPPGFASPCQEGEFLYSELIGAKLFSRAEGRKLFLASVTGLLEGAAQLLLELKLNPELYTPKLLYFPFHHSLLGQIHRLENNCLHIEVLQLEYFEALLSANASS